MFAFMEKSDEDAEHSDEITLADLKKSLDTCSLKKMRKLATLLIDSLFELITEKAILNNSLENFQDEKSFQ